MEITKCDFYWDDVVVGATERSASYEVTEAEIVGFAERFDPLPIHLDQRTATAGPFGSITAPGCYMLAIRQRLLHGFAYTAAVIASIGYEEVRFLAPLRAGQICEVNIAYLEKRPSGKSADRGITIIGMRLMADGEAVLHLKDIVLMRRRAAPDSGAAE